MAIGWMAEWSKAAVLKTVEVQASGHICNHQNNQHLND